MMKKTVNKLANASKFWVALATAAEITINTFYGSQKWAPAVVLGIGSLLVYLVPNAPTMPIIPPEEPKP